MSSWHYQLMRHKDGSLAVHEYYPSDGGAGWTKEPISIVSIVEDDVEDVKKMLQMMLNDIDKHGIKSYE